jgi:hypothetical protein
MKCVLSLRAAEGGEAIPDLMREIVSKQQLEIASSLATLAPRNDMHDDVE